MNTPRIRFPYDLFGVVEVIARGLAPSTGNEGAGSAPPKARPEPEPEHGLARWFDRLDRWMWERHQREAERFYAEATDLADLERRLHAYETGTAGRYH